MLHEFPHGGRHPFSPGGRAGADAVPGLRQHALLARQRAPTESLVDFTALERWLEAAGVVDARTGASLQSLRRTDPAAAQRLFDDALQLRELLYRLFAALAGGTPPAAESPGPGRLAGRHTAAPALGARGPARRLARAHGVARRERGAGAGAVVGGRPGTGHAQRVRLRQCANEKCRWLFVDDSKGGSRRWCSMRTCGNRAKVQRHALRKAGRSLL
jgi:predicted RNA-binding Zn ribbon-like protein